MDWFLYDSDFCHVRVKLHESVHYKSSKKESKLSFLE